MVTKETIIEIFDWSLERAKYKSKYNIFNFHQSFNVVWNVMTKRLEKPFNDIQININKDIPRIKLKYLFGGWFYGKRKIEFKDYLLKYWERKTN